MARSRGSRVGRCRPPRNPFESRLPRHSGTMNDQILWFATRGAGVVSLLLFTAVHWLAYAAWPLTLLHGVGSGTDSWALWMLPTQAACVLAVAVAVAWRFAAGRSNRSQLASVVDGGSRGGA